VCESLDSQYIAKHRFTYALDGSLAWWVLDRWVDGHSLESLLEEGKQFSPAEVFKIGRQILLGLSDLHSHKIIVRELSPERIIYNEQDESVVLTDFEMAKLMDKGVPSVSGRWKHNSPYRAREVIEDIDQPWPHSLSFRSDLFSWAVIMIELLTGSTNTTPTAIRDKIKNTRWAELLIKCSNMAASKRPANVDQVIEQWVQVSA
jgi:serine/threonine protein kinase